MVTVLVVVVVVIFLAVSIGALIIRIGFWGFLMMIIVY